MRKLLIMATAMFVLSACCCGKSGNKADETAAAQQENKMIRLNVFVTTSPENLDEVVAGLNELAAGSRAEEGCIGYDIFQNTIEPTSLIIVETWADDAALTAHQSTPHYTTILPALGDKMTTRLERFGY